MPSFYFSIDLVSHFLLISIGLQWNTQLAKLGFTTENEGVEIVEKHWTEPPPNQVGLV